MKTDLSSCEFDRCIYCFSPKTSSGVCSECGYDNGLCSPPAYLLMPGTVLKGNYVVGRHLSSNETEIKYLGFDIKNGGTVEIVEYFPKAYVTRDVTNTDEMVPIPSHKNSVERGREDFFLKAKLYYNCVSRVKALYMDFFYRNGTCYYVRKKDG